MSNMEACDTVESSRRSLKKFDHIEGSITKFPEQLLGHVASIRCQEFTTSSWGAGTRTQTLNESYEGNPMKFVRLDDPDMSELPSGRFWHNSKKQIIVVGIPTNETPSALRYVIVRWSTSCTKPQGLDNWSGHRWKVWKPRKFSDYYRDVPHEVVRMERYGRTPTHNTDGDYEAVSNDANPPQVNRPAKAFEAPAQSEQTSSVAEVIPSTLKRTLPSCAQPELSSTPSKRTCTGNKRCQDGDSLGPSNHQQSGPEHNQVVDNLLSTYWSKERQRWERVSTLPVDTRYPVSKMKTENYKEGIVDIKSETTAGRTTLTDVAHSPPVFQKIRSANPSCSSSTDFLPRENGGILSTQKGAVGTKDRAIDLTEEDECEIMWGRNVFVHFMDSQVAKHVTTFDQCSTAKRFFEEACTAEIVDKDTRMLEVQILGAHAARIRRDDDVHFDRMVLEPINMILPSLHAGQAIHLEVRKYM